ncbi:uncharacterized protein LOC129598484 [Paramacrobiotus metropolitanus]|uniref:uncharacterized protein LOC129598484 n=1 Tax=Paramacrobiotus metropolitanus TaxID=2943436 RepID=UPI0024463575|nr:uncharacterized protein LOC129598484 [Paramacrobiotus metropolitanus]
MIKMLGVLWLCVISLAWLAVANGDDIPYTIPAGQPDGFAQYVRIEKPYPNGGSNKQHQFDHLPGLGIGLGQGSRIVASVYDDTLKPGEKRCPVDGDPHCRDCVAGYKASDFVQSQCCFAHHWAWMNNRPIRDVLPYRFHLSPVNQTEPPEYRDKYAITGDIWHEDPCTTEPIATIPEGGYIPCRQRNACPKVRGDGTIY